MRQPLATLAVLALAALPARADDMASSLSGSWSFTARVPEPCTFSGIAVLTPTGDAGIYGCELTAHQSCSGDIIFTVRQSCRARRTGNQVSISSTIVEFLEGEPTPFYLPDNFTLSLTSPRRMAGALVSSGSYAAEFVRSEEGVS